MGETYTYVVTSVNKAHQESTVSQAYSILQKYDTRIKRVKTQAPKVKKKTPVYAGAI
ncbi:MAG: hypothetical protein R2795_05825 [Saprospiraceae bacterium]